MPKIKDLFSERIVEGALSYQVPPEAGNLDWWKYLIDESAENSVTIISPMVGQDSICEPFNHCGFDYPSEIHKKWRNPTCKEINHSEHLIGVFFFNISAVPESHPNLESNV